MRRVEKNPLFSRPLSMRKCKGGFVLQLNHKTLYESLHNITMRVKIALGDNDIEGLVQLGEEHEKIMNDLKHIGLSDDPLMLDLIKEVKDEVDELVAEIERKRNETGRELKKIGNGKKLVTAYGR